MGLGGKKLRKREGEGKKSDKREKKLKKFPPSECKIDFFAKRGGGII